MASDDEQLGAMGREVLRLYLFGGPATDSPGPEWERWWRSVRPIYVKRMKEVLRARAEGGEG